VNKDWMIKEGEKRIEAPTSGGHDPDEETVDPEKEKADKEKEDEENEKDAKQVPARLEARMNYFTTPKVVRQKNGKLVVVTDLVKTNTKVEAHGEPRLDTLNDLAKDMKEHNPKVTVVKNYVTNHNTTAAHTNTTANLTDEERAERSA